MVLNGKISIEVLDNGCVIRWFDREKEYKEGFIDRDSFHDRLDELTGLQPLDGDEDDDEEGYNPVPLIIHPSMAERIVRDGVAPQTPPTVTDED